MMNNAQEAHPSDWMRFLCSYLNGNLGDFIYGQNLTTGAADLNDILNNGSYFISNTASHNPYAQIGILTVAGYQNKSGTTYRKSQMFVAADGSFATRYYSGDWSDWQLSDNLYIANGAVAENCNNLTTPGIYPKVITATATNGPGYYAYLLNLHYNDVNNNNITQVAFGYNTGTISIRNRYNGTWSVWAKS